MNTGWSFLWCLLVHVIAYATINQLYVYRLMNVSSRWRTTYSNAILSDMTHAWPFVVPQLFPRYFIECMGGSSNFGNTENLRLVSRMKKKLMMRVAPQQANPPLYDT